MTLTAFGFESGSNGDAVTTGNTGFDAIAISGSGTSGVISTAQSAHGTRSVLFTKAVASGTCYIQKTISSTAVAVRGYYRMSALPSGDQTIIWLGNGTSQRANVEVTSAGAIRFRDDASGAQFVNGGPTTSSGTMSTNTWYRIEFYANMSTGAARLVVYAGDSTTPVTNMDSGARTSINFGADSFTSLRVGAGTSTGTTTMTTYVDDVAVEDAATGLIGAYGVPPTVDAGANQNVSASATVNLSATANDTDGSISSHAWTYVSASSTGSPTLTGSSTATPSFTSGSAGNLYTLQDLVTDNDGFTASDTVEIRVPKAGSASKTPLAINKLNSAGTWSNVGGVSTDGGALADSSDSTYLESAALSGTEQWFEVRVEPTSAQATGQIVVRLATSTGTGNAVIRLVEGATVRETFNQAITTTITDYTLTLAGGTISAISDWGDLRLRIGATT